jgi:hypothetical protein
MLEKYLVLITPTEPNIYTRVPKKREYLRVISSKINREATVKIISFMIPIRV